ncbi:ATP-binding protein [Psychrobacter jeotgali]|uniref:ATP-binding protein n=1 Tax=Psychrobacter jeotgali TaxID=179010 RepID=UPI00191824F6|nr:ATP-binding protein [Psychrobacter jeotgali]
MISPRQLFKSMQFQLIFWSVLALLFLAIIAGGYGFWYSYEELNEFQDDSLESMAALIEQTINIGGTGDNILLESNIHFDTDDEEGSITVDVLNTAIATPVVYYSSHDSDDHDNDGDDNNNSDNNNIDKTHKDEDFDTITVADLASIPVGISTKVIDKDTWRIYRSDSADNVVIVRQRTEFQDELARSSALQSFLPLIIGIALLTLLLPFIMWRMLRPVRQLQTKISQRRDNDLSPLPIDNLPTELLPFAQSLNRLLIVVKSSIERQQRFIADAAHELRSPLTAISLQLQRLQRVTDDEVMVKGLDKLALRLKRNQQLVEQLLTLARAGNINSSSQDELTPVSVKATIEQVIGLLIPIIDNKNIALSVDLAADEPVNIDETSLLIVIKNIIQNAIIYTPNNGQVTINLFKFHSDSINNDSNKANLGQHVIQSNANANAIAIDHFDKPNKLDKGDNGLNNRLALQVMDTGKGVNPADYEAIFDPFVRLSTSKEPSGNAIDANSAAVTLQNAELRRSDSASNPMQEVEGIDGIEGTGLGLSIVKSICEQSGIEVFLSQSTLNSNAGQRGSGEYSGLCVTLVFPPTALDN